MLTLERGAKVLSHFRSGEQKFQGTKVPGNESSMYGTVGTKVPVPRGTKATDIVKQPN